GREINGAGVPRGGRQRQKGVNRIVDVHEVDQVLPVAPDGARPLAGHDREEPTRGDLPLRLVRAVGAEEANVDETIDSMPSFSEVPEVLFGRQLRDRVRQVRIDRRRRLDVADRAIGDSARGPPRPSYTAPEEAKTTCPRGQCSSRLISPMALDSRSQRGRPADAVG